ncbi:hypothetical protein E4K72_08665 [Oxalobacteraceae bacterium OM1]|nr:hypothetical protein E4K72_08665 [Oxalobacteraceae bacterium OM1]
MLHSTLPAACRPDTGAATFVAGALMPDRDITAALVARSAMERIADLHALAQAVRQLPGRADLQDDWDDALRCIDAADDDYCVAVGSSPLFRRWLHACGRALIEGADAATLSGMLAYVRNYVIGVTAGGVPLPQRHGAVETWDCLRSAAADLPNTDTAVHAMDSLPRSRIIVRNDLPGLRVSLDESRVPERDSAVRANAVEDRRHAYPAGRFPVLLEAAMALLAAWPEEYEDWRQTLRVVVPRMPPRGWRMEGFTVSSMQGAVWIHPGRFLAVLESLVHEQSHVKLRYVEEAVPLLADQQTDDRFAVGWRTDRRPIVGIYEGVYVHIHCAIAFARCLDLGVLDAGLREEASVRLRDLVAQAREGLQLLRLHARFTPAGQGFLDWARRALQELPH